MLRYGGDMFFGVGVNHWTTPYRGQIRLTHWSDSMPVAAYFPAAYDSMGVVSWGYLLEPERRFGFNVPHSSRELNESLRCR